MNWSAQTLSGRDYLAQVRRSHTSLDSHHRARCSPELNCKETFAFNSSCFSLGFAGCSGRRHHGGHECPTRSQLHECTVIRSTPRQVFLAVLLFPAVKLVTCNTQIIQPFIIWDLVLCTIGLNFQNLFSCKHIYELFANVARISPGYKMHFLGGLLSHFILKTLYLVD